MKQRTPHPLWRVELWGPHVNANTLSMSFFLCVFKALGKKLGTHAASSERTPMQPNPIVEQLQAEQAVRCAAESYRYPFHIVCVYLDEDSNDFPIIQEVREYCKGNQLTFMARQYNAEKYEEDIAIPRLPAFHIYYKKYCYETHYYDTNPVHKIQVVVWAFQDREKEKERKRQKRIEQWNAFKSGWSSIFTLDHFKRKAALDRDACLQKSRMDSSPKVAEV